MSRFHGRVAEAFGVNEPERLSLSEMLGNSLGLALALLAAFTLVHASAGLLPLESQTWLKAALLLGAGFFGVIVSTLSSRYYAVFLSVRNSLIVMCSLPFRFLSFVLYEDYGFIIQEAGRSVKRGPRPAR